MTLIGEWNSSIGKHACSHQISEIASEIHSNSKVLLYIWIEILNRNTTGFLFYFFQEHMLEKLSSHKS